MDTLKVPDTNSEDGSKTPVSFRTGAYAIMASLPSRSARMSVHSPSALSKRRKSSVQQRRKSIVLHPGIVDEKALFDKAQRRGLVIEIQDEDTYDEIARMRQVEIIREMAVPMQMKRRLRAKAFEHRPLSYQGSWAAFWSETRAASYRNCTRIKSYYRELVTAASLWRGSLKNIEGHFGGGVLTYFRFLKWLFCLNMCIFLLIFLFIVIPQVTFPAGSYTVYDTSGISSTNHTQRAVACTALYTVDVANNDTLQLAIDFLQGTGWMEKTLVFYGAYVGERLSLTGPLANSSYNLPLAYIIVVIVYFVLSLVMIVHYTAAGMRARLLGSEHNLRPYCNQVFANWDYGLSDQKNCDLQHRAICREIMVNLEEERNEIKLKNRNRSEKCVVYTKRLFINLFVVGILVGSGYLIYTSTVKNLQATQSPSYASLHPLVKLLMQYATSLTISALNVLVPVVFQRVVRWEMYSTAMEVNITLVRTVFLRLASLGVLLFTLYVKINCSDKDVCLVGENDCSALRCWETYVGHEFYKLVITDFLTPIAMVFCVEFPRKLLVTRFDTKLTRMIGLQEFDIPKNVLDLIYTEVLLWFGSFFAPLLSGIILVKCFVLFYLKMLSLLSNFTPSSKAHRASDSEFFFLIVLMLAYTGCITPIMYCIWWVTPSTGCGPFRIYHHMHSVIGGAISSWPTWLGNIYNFICSAAFIIPAFVILCLVIYYINMMMHTYKRMTFAMREQLLMEGQDKQFLLARIQEGDSATTAAPANPKLNVDTSRKLEVSSPVDNHPNTPQDLNGRF